MGDVVTANEAPPQAIPKMAEFNVDLGDGRMAIVILPVGVSPTQMLRLVAALPALGAQASAMGRSRLLIPR